MQTPCVNLTTKLTIKSVPPDITSILVSKIQNVRDAICWVLSVMVQPTIVHNQPVTVIDFGSRCLKGWVGVSIASGVPIGLERQNHELRKAAEAIEAAKAHVPPSLESPPENDSSDSDGGEEIPEANPTITVQPAPETQENSLAEKYELAELSISTSGLDLPDVSLFTMENWIQDVVKIESPVHLDEVARRIATAVGVSQIDNPIRKKVKTAARQAMRSGSVQIREGFLYWTEQEEVTVRDRGGLPKASRKLELIAPEEIETAIKQVVSAAFGMGRVELTRRVCWFFGFKPASAKMRQEVDRVVERLIEEGQLI